jgi:adenylate cyclase
MKPTKFFAELKRRKVYSVAVTYAVVGWLIAQIATQIFPFFFATWVVQIVIIVIALGFPVALILAWVYDFTRHGIIRTSDLDKAKAASQIEMTVPEAISVRTASGERSIAVLPFNDLSAGRDHDYFSDGIAEEILSALSKIEGLRVAARRSSFWFKGKDAQLSEIAEKLNVEHVLEGSIRRDGNRVRITAELINAADGFTVWSETFDREMQGIFAVQDEITRSIVEALKFRLDISAALTSRSLDAYDLYLQGLFYSDRPSEEALRQSLEFFGRTLEKDPHWSRAWTGIAKAWLWLADAYVPPREAYSKVREAATNALRIDNDDAEAHVYLGEVKRILDWDMDGAAREFCRAVELDPKSTPSNYFSAAFWAARGERDEALMYLKRTSNIDPASLWVNNSACELYRYFALYDEAVAAGERALQLDPAFVYGEPLLAALYRETGRFEDAIALYKRAENLSSKPAFGLAITYARMGSRDEAVRALNAATANRRYTPGDAIAHVQVALGEHDDAILELERACEERSSSLHFVGIAPEFGPLRSDPRFVAILERIGLEPKKIFASAPYVVREAALPAMGR